ncbi:MAG: LysM peptidoglycan-binding domain-containing protein [Spirochaetota bacterium]|nr:LysM peptidoglycan-binding domain-containing protein [Spirochaetota bacterium]
MIENFHTFSQEYYDEGNYLNAIDQAREGLRLADLYLASQTLFTHTVVPRDTLWDISKRAYKTPWLWPNIWRANKLDIKDPDLIYPGQKFRIPPALTNPN